MQRVVLIAVSIRITNLQEIVRRDFGTSVVTSSSRRSASAFGIDELLGLSRRDVIVTSFPPEAEGRRRLPSPVVDGGTLPCCCSVDVDHWTGTSSPDSSRTRRPSLLGTSPQHTAIADVTLSDKQRGTGNKRLEF